MDDRTILRRAQKGDRDAFRELVELHQDEVFYLALGLLRNRDDAEDIVQNVFIRAYKSLHRFRGEARISTWFYRITLNACRDHQRKGRFRAFQVSLGLASEADTRFVEERADANPWRRAAGSQVRQDLDQALGKLSPAERETFVLRQLSQLSIRETAEATGRAEGTVKNLLFRALQKLRDELAVYQTAEEAR